MAKKQAEAIQDLVGQFLVVWHDEPGYLAYSGNVEGDNMELVLPPAVKVPVDDRWMKVANFVRDVQLGKLHTERSDVVPAGTRPDVDSMEYELTPTQRELARRIAWSESIPETVWGAVEIHRLLRAGGVAPQGVAVKKSYLVTEHSTFLRATIDVEKRCKNRAPVIERLKKALDEIGAM